MLSEGPEPGGGYLLAQAVSVSDIAQRSASALNGGLISWGVALFNQLKEMSDVTKTTGRVR